MYRYHPERILISDMANFYNVLFFASSSEVAKEIYEHTSFGALAMIVRMYYGTCEFDI